MPREPIDLPHRVERIGVLSEDGELDDELLPDLDDEALVSLYHTMVLSRAFDRRQLKLQRQGRIGTFAPVSGQEASQVGAIAALREDDWVVPSFRETAAAIGRGLPLEGLLLYNAGFNEGGRIPDEQRDLPISVPVGSQIPHAVGIAYAARARAEDHVAMTFFGDGATSEGDFHESLNFAAVLELPVVFVCQNNHWAISLPVEEQTASKTLAQKGLAYGMPCLQVDGNDLLAVYVAAHEAVERARAGDGPTLIECVTYRLEVHTTADDPTRYRDDDEVEAWKERDPIPRLRDYLLQRGALDDERVEAIDGEVEERVDQAWSEAKRRIDELDDPLVMFDHVFESMPDVLAAQRDALAAALEADGGSHG